MYFKTSSRISIEGKKKNMTSNKLNIYSAKLRRTGNPPLIRIQTHTPRQAYPKHTLILHTGFLIILIIFIPSVKLFSIF